MAKPRSVATDIVRTLRGAGYVAYFAGGCVRDELLGREPKDYDVATDATPDDVRALFKRTNEVGAAFGVMLVRQRGVTTEVTTFREESRYTDRRRPDEVRYADAVADAHRRDFTINALFLDPLDRPDPFEAADAPRANPPFHVDGRVIDYVGGLLDLHDRSIRAVGDPEARLAEDHLRALRAVRFAARLGFTIEARTSEAMRRHTAELRGVSRERIGEEIRMMLTTPGRGAAAALIEDFGLDAPTLDEAAIGAGVDPQRSLLGRLPAEAAYSTALAAWALDRLDRRLGGLAEAEEIADEARRVGRDWRRALMLSNENRDVLGATLGMLARLESGWLEERIADQKKSAASAGFNEALLLLELRRPDQAAAARERLETLQSDGVGLTPAPLASGEDLLEVGVPGGPEMGRLLERLYDAQLEGRIRTHEQALNFVRREVGGSGEPG